MNIIVGSETEKFFKKYWLDAYQKISSGTHEWSGAFSCFDPGEYKFVERLDENCGRFRNESQTGVAVSFEKNDGEVKSFASMSPILVLKKAN